MNPRYLDDAELKRRANYHAAELKPLLDEIDRREAAPVAPVLRLVSGGAS